MSTVCEEPIMELSITPEHLKGKISNIEFDYTPQTDTVCCILTTINGTQIAGVSSRVLRDVSKPAISGHEQAYQLALDQLSHLEKYLEREMIFLKTKGA